MDPASGQRRVRGEAGKCLLAPLMTPDRYAVSSRHATG